MELNSLWLNMFFVVMSSWMMARSELGSFIWGLNFVAVLLNAVAIMRHVAG